MLSLQQQTTRLCDGWSRREMLRAGGLGALGLSLAGMEALRAQAAKNRANDGANRRAEGFGRAKRCILLFLLGGPPQHETWDPKPDAPAEIRGELKPISSAVPGLAVGELMPQTARRADRVAVLRAVSTDDNAHSASGYWMLTGRPHTPKNKENAGVGPPNDDPCVAAIVRRLRGDAALPGSIVLPEEIWNTGRIVWPGQSAGWLGPAADPWLITCHPDRADFRVPDIALPPEITVARFDRRRSLLSAVNRQLDQTQRRGSVQRWSGLRQKTFELLGSQAARKAFALDQESSALRDRYGRNRFGQSVLLARRLIEADVSLVQVNWTRWKEDQAVAPAWDTHAGNAQRLKTALMPPMDQAYSALLDDLQQRGLLEETLVVWMGEFGRTPRINKRGGRDHWGHVYSVALAGAGIQPGAVYGRSDARGAFPMAGRVEPQDITATIFHCLGLDPETKIHDAFGRPFPISTGQPIRPILTA